MGNAEDPNFKMQDLLRAFQEHHRLVTMINTMAREIERLDEENAQLRAAISIYREVVRRENGDGRANRLPHAG